ncbi:MAG TPA: 4-alpha-glucanotransferase [Ignavibacteria bacterium]|nr:4-alpha-glucanotransferase [Ignavibacteria bacterium]
MNYNSLLNSKTSEKWKKTGIRRRAGVALPLFSVFSDKSIGIGEIPDLRYIIDWCCQTGMSVLQLLPLNEVGNDFAPYNSISTFALEPMYISIKKLRKADLSPFRKELRSLRKRFPKGGDRVNYEIKNEKLKLLRKIFATVDLKSISKYNEFVSRNIHWLKYYSLFKILTGLNDGRNWNEWELKYQYVSSLTSQKVLHAHNDEVEFQYWLQWQLYEQLITIKKYAKRKNVLIMGDLPFLVSRNSADVWAYKNYFKLNLSSGAPPDVYFSKGQRWGMPPYNWENIAADNYSYLKERLVYAENYFDMFRIDHFVGLFRVWTIDLKTPPEYAGFYGIFDPEDERQWEDHGSRILGIMNSSTSMLPCAEDLGTVPACSEKVLKEFGITGINVQRWEKTKSGNFHFLPPDEYRINSVATVSTHDSSSLPGWWKYEAGTVDELSFKLSCEKLNVKDHRYLNLLSMLFVNEDSETGKIKWRKEVSNVYRLLEILEMNYDEAKEITEIYLSSFGEKNNFRRYIGLDEKTELADPVSFIKNTLEMINSTSSVFSIQLIMEYLYLDKNTLEKYSGWNQRINFPGTVDGNNWSMVIPFALEELKDLKINDTISDILKKSDRI